MRKKRIVLLCLSLVVSLWVSCAGAQTVFCGKSYDTQARYIDLEDTEITDWEAFFEFLDGFSGLEKVDMFATCVDRKTIAQMAERYPKITFGWTIQFAEHTVRTDATAFSTISQQRSSSDNFSISPSSLPGQESPTPAARLVGYAQEGAAIPESL